MSLKYYMIIAVKNGHERIDLTQNHDRAYASEFLQTIGHTRHKYRGELVPHRWTDSDLLIFANNSGVVAQGFSLAIHMALGMKKSQRAAGAYGKLLALAHNDQSLIDAFSYYENGSLTRRVVEMDGNERSDVIMEGNLLPEEINAIVTSHADPETESDQQSEFVVDEKTYVVDGFTPMRGCSLELAKRFGIDVDWLPPSASFYNAKPWWMRW